MGSLWISLFLLFIMFFYEYNFVYYKKGVLEDKANFKMVYRDMRKVSRKIAVGFLLFAVVTVCLIYELHDEFSDCLMRGCVVAVPAIYFMNKKYGDKSRFRFSFS